jgi:circadian clock protein KaiC
MSESTSKRPGSASKTAIDGRRASFPKAPTGIEGLDEITGGGLPRGRPTLICGGAGCGKTLFAMEFLVRGAALGEPGVFLAFEETGEELTQNVRSLGFDLEDLVRREQILLDHVQLERSEIEETGEYDLEGLFIRLGHAIDTIGAKRVVLDTLEMLFAGLSNPVLLRSELSRLFRWLKEKQVTALVTAERGAERAGMLTRNGLEEYISDCVILLDHRVVDEVSTRRLRIVKYRGSVHGTNEYPFMIDENGISVLPVTSLGLRHEASDERISTGIPRLDAMLGGKGVFRGSSVLVSGPAGTGKTSVAAHFTDAACRRGERCVYFALEESRSQLVRNMRSIGIDLQQWIGKKLLRYLARRSTAHGLELHLATLHKEVEAFQPHVVIVDPITPFLGSGTAQQAESMLTRLIDFLKARGATALFTTLTQSREDSEESQIGVSSLIDTWFHLRDVELGGERNRTLYIPKSRGMAHSNQVREFLLTDRGVELRDVYLGPEGVLTGSMRSAQEARERSAALTREQELQRRRRELDNKRMLLEEQIRSHRARFAAEESGIEPPPGSGTDRPGYSQPGS